MEECEGILLGEIRDFSQPGKTFMKKGYVKSVHILLEFVRKLGGFYDNVSAEVAGIGGDLLRLH